MKDCVAEDKYFSLHPSEFFSETPVIKDSLMRETHRSSFPAWLMSTWGIRRGKWAAPLGSFWGRRGVT